MEASSGFMERLEKVMSGICPECGGPMNEEQTDITDDEWTISCTKCPYILVFGNEFNPYPPID